MYLITAPKVVCTYIFSPMIYIYVNHLGSLVEQELSLEEKESKV